MSDIRESFPTLEDGSQVGAPLRAVQQGDSVAAKNGSLGFAFKDSSGNAIAAPVNVSGDAAGNAVPTLSAVNNAGTLVSLPVKVAGNAPGNAVPVLGFKDSSGNLVNPQLNSSGQLPVTFDIVGDNKTARGLLTGTGTPSTVASLTLTASKTYQNIEVSVACFRDSIFQLIKSDNAVETVLADILVGSGQYTAFLGFENLEFTAGATGTQLLLVRGSNLSATSDMRSTIACKQL